MESFRPVGTNLLCVRASTREQKKAEIYVPAAQGTGQRARRAEGMPRVMELIVKARGEAEGCDSGDKELMETYLPGHRIAVANSPVAVIFLDGEEHIIVDAKFVEGIVNHDAEGEGTA